MLINHQIDCLWIGADPPLCTPPAGGRQILPGMSDDAGF